MHPIPSQNHHFSVNLEQCETLPCSKCKGIFFTTVAIMKKIPKILSGQDNSISIINLFKCDNCGKISEIMNPVPKEIAEWETKKGGSE